MSKPKISLEEYYGSSDNPAYFKGKESRQPVEIAVYPNGTARVEYINSNVIPNKSNQLEKSDVRLIEKTKADEKIHKQFDSNSWKNFLITQALGAAAAGTGAAASSYILNIPGMNNAISNAINTYGVYEGTKRFTSNNGLRKTLKLLQNKDYKGFGFSLLGDASDIFLMNGAKSAYNAAKTVGKNSLEYTKDLARYIDSGGIPKSQLLTDTPNSLRRLIGTGTTGYEDALKTGIIRGNPKPSLTGNTKQTRKLGEYLLKHGYKRSDIRNLLSQNLTESSFNNLKSGIQNYYKRFETFDKIADNGSKIRLKPKKALDIGSVESYDDYLKLLNDAQEAHNIEIFLRNNNRIKGYEWIKNWGEHPQATFALHGERLDNNLLFPGDYGVKINNAEKYAKEASPLGHFEFHPTTEYPLSITNPDVNFYVRKDGLFGKKYMKLIPKDKVMLDQKLIEKGMQVKNKPRINKLFNR